MTDLAVNLPGLAMKNPIMPASGTFGFGDVPAAKKFDLNKMGALVIKTTTLKARKGNPQPQIAVLKDGVLNSVGLTNPGVDQVVKDKLPQLRAKYPLLPIMASVGGESEADYVTVAQKLAASKLVNALEINVSCPNVAKGGMSFGVHPQIVKELTRKIKERVSLPVYVKLTPNVTDIVAIAKAAEAGGADGLSLINTLLGMEIDIRQRRPVLGNNFGGLSGQAVQAVALRMVYQVHQAVDLPIIGMGGISSARDIVAFLLAGASAVAVGSAHFHDSLAIPHLAQDLRKLLPRLQVEKASSLVGQLQLN